RPHGCPRSRHRRPEENPVGAVMGAAGAPNLVPRLSLGTPYPRLCLAEAPPTTRFRSGALLSARRSLADRRPQRSLGTRTAPLPAKSSSRGISPLSSLHYTFTVNPDELLTGRLPCVSPEQPGAWRCSLFWDRPSPAGPNRSPGRRYPSSS